LCGDGVRFSGDYQAPCCASDHPCNQSKPEGSVLSRHRAIVEGSPVFAFIFVDSCRRICLPSPPLPEGIWIIMSTSHHQHPVGDQQLIDRIEKPMESRKPTTAGRGFGRGEKHAPRSRRSPSQADTILGESSTAIRTASKNPIGKRALSLASRDVEPAHERTMQR